MSIRRNRRPLRYACLAALGLLTATGCGDDGPTVTAQTGPPRPLPPVATQTAATQAADTPPPALIADDDPLTPPDPMAGVGDDTTVADAATPEAEAPDPLADAGTDLGATTGPQMPTRHSHWLSLAQFGERVTVRLNEVWYGEFSGPALRDITMRLRPGPNTLTVTAAPQSADSWLAVHVTEGEHAPPIPDLVAYRIAPARESDRGDAAGRLTPTTLTFRFTAR